MSTLQSRRRHDADTADQLVAFMPYRTLEGDGSVSEGHAEREVADAVHSATGTGSNKSPKVVGGGMVRRLTPTECERLQALPDGWTLLEDSDDLNPLPDGRRYAACGDAVTASVAEWIGRRLLTPATPSQKENQQ